MSGSRNRLINAARRSMIQRAELRRKLDVARGALTPRALLDRGKYRIGAKVDDTAHAARQQFRDNRLPIALAAAAGLAWIFREPIKEHVPRAAGKLRELIDAGLEKFRPGESAEPEDDELEDQNEAAQ